MATIKFTTKGTNKEKSIYLKLYFKDEYNEKHNIFKNTGLKTQVESFNKIQTAKRSKLNTAEKNTQRVLEDLEDNIFNSLDTDIKNSTLINKDWLQFRIDVFFKRVTETKKISNLLTESIEELILTASHRPNGKKGVGLSETRIRQYKRLKEIVLEFQKETKRKYKVKDVDRIFAMSFLSYLEERLYSTSYQQKKLSDIKVACNNARSLGIEVSRQLQDIKITSVSNEYINYLDEKEIEAIRKLNIDDPVLDNARKWVLLGCYVGQRGNDLVNLTSKNIVIKGGRKYFEVEQQKTAKKVLIPFNREIEEVLKNGFPYHLNLNGSNGLNKKMKTIGELAEINKIIEGKKRDKKTDRMVKGMYPKYELLRTHDLRRTFATNLYNKLPTPVIMAITGHKTEQVLIKYIGKTSIDMATQLAEYYDKEEIKKDESKRMIILKKASNQ